MINSITQPSPPEDHPDYYPSNLDPALPILQPETHHQGYISEKSLSSTTTALPELSSQQTSSGMGKDKGGFSGQAENENEKEKEGKRWFCPKPWTGSGPGFGGGGGWSGWLAQDIGTAEMVPTLVLQAFSTGVLDATTYADFLTFASNQTGNTILLCVAAIGTTSSAMVSSEIRLVLTAISLGTFLVCAGVFGHLGHFMGTRRRSWLIITNTVQILVLFLALLLLAVGPPSTRIGGSAEWLPLALFAGMSGAQVAQARQSGSQELPTAPMTSSYVDLMGDRYLFKWFTHPKAGPRNKRLAYILAMVAGGMLGAVIHRWAGSWEVVAVTMGLKVVVLGWLCCLRGEERRVGGGTSNV